MSLTIFGIAISAKMIQIAGIQIMKWLKEDPIFRPLPPTGQTRNFRPLPPTEQTRSIAVLGMKEAGKTSLHCALMNVPYVKLETSFEKYPAYIYKKKDGLVIHIQEGWDVGGGNYFRRKYNKMIDDADIVFFLFDLVEYRNKKGYAEETRSRLEYVTRKCNETGKELVTLITHKDAFTQQQLCKAVNDYKEDVLARTKTSTPYDDAVLNYKFFTINTTDRNEIRSIIDTIL